MVWCVFCHDGIETHTVNQAMPSEDDAGQRSTLQGRAGEWQGARPAREIICSRHSCTFGRNSSRLRHPRALLAAASPANGHMARAHHAWSDNIAYVEQEQGRLLTAFQLLVCQDTGARKAGIDPISGTVHDLDTFASAAAPEKAGPTKSKVPGSRAGDEVSHPDADTAVLVGLRLLVSFSLD